MKLAVVKPDHLGDLVLSSPAIRALSAAHADTTLIVAGSSLALARALFPGLETAVLNLPHLAKSGGQAAAADFRPYDAVAILRRDAVVSPAWASLRMRRFAMFEGSDTTHQTVLDYGVAREFAPAYDIDALFYGERRDQVAAKAAADPGHVGLSIGSGFYANSWPLTRWIELGQALQRQGRRVTIVHGPAEAAAAAILAKAIRGAGRIAGGSDFQAFFDAVSALDLVVASDGGTAHLCSLVAPVLSIFGPSPVRRYCPTGPWNRALTQLLSCSPCCQYAERMVNGCLSVECMTGITAEDVLAALADRVQPGQSGQQAEIRPGLFLIKGPAWLGRADQIRRRDFEARFWADTGAPA